MNLPLATGAHRASLRPMPDRRTPLATTLCTFRPADAVESQHALAMANLLANTAAPFARDQFSPGHFTASAFIVDEQFSQILLIFQAKLQRWLQPGGHIDDDDEDVEAAARREIAEETGLTDLTLLAAPLDLDVHAIPAYGSVPAHLHFDVRFLFCAPRGAGVAGSDAHGLRWVPLQQVSGDPYDESVLRAVRKIAARFGNHPAIGDLSSAA